MPANESSFKLGIDNAVVAECRAIATDICAPILELARTHTTTSIERACLRLVGVVDNGQRETLSPALVNDVVDAIQHKCGLQHGAMIPFFDAVNRFAPGDVSATAQAIAAGDVMPEIPGGEAHTRAVNAAEVASRTAVGRLQHCHEDRRRMLERFGDKAYPWIYLIVATGNIHEDIRQAKAAALGGAHVIAVIRSTAQSLLDFVPTGATIEGYGGTYATQENFRLMRRALDEVSAETGYYVRLTNFASGLCMPEMAALAAVERLDVMLNDSMYGIIFRDINMQRTFIDQHFSRQVHAAAQIMINTGEDAYLKIDDPVTAAHTVFASNFINEHLALAAGMPASLVGLGRATEMSPEIEGQILLELAQAQLARECFPEAPLKWMPPTRHLDGDIFMAYVYNAVYNLIGALTDQDIVLMGMVTEAMHNPLISDRELAIDNARYIQRASTGISREISFRPDGVIAQRAKEVLANCHSMMTHIADIGLFAAIEGGMFVGVKRSRHGGRGLEGVVPKAETYRNPIGALLDGTAGR
jgi:beta-lysine 5,6-aminomutase alpha subunit